MNIAIVGSGNIGSALGRLWARAGHKVYFSFSHDPSKLEQLAQEAGNGSKAAVPYDAVYCSDVVLFSPPWRAVDEALKQIGAIHGKLVIDTTNPFVDDRMNVEEFDATDSSSESVARRMEQATVVKAFNTLKAETLANRSGEGLAVFYCGDDAVAKGTVDALIRDAGFEPVDAGTLHDGTKQQPGTDRFLKELTREQAQAMVDGKARVETGVVEGSDRADRSAVSG